MTQNELKSLLKYDKDTGIFTHAKDKGRLAKKGDIAGAINSKGYRVIKVKSKPYKAHRLAWLYEYGNMDIDQIDHINGIRDDNRISNLRNVSDLENSRNMSIPKNNTSGLIGVRWCNTKNRWIASIGENNITKTIGTFKNKMDAIQARKNAEVLYGFHENHGKENR